MNFQFDILFSPVFSYFGLQKAFGPFVNSPFVYPANILFGSHLFSIQFLFFLNTVFSIISTKISGTKTIHVQFLAKKVVAQLKMLTTDTFFGSITVWKTVKINSFIKLFLSYSFIFFHTSIVIFSIVKSDISWHETYSF